MKKRTVWITGGLVVVLFVALAGVGFQVYHKQPSFCSVCHIMDPYVDSLIGEEATYMGSSHYEKDVVCIDCHEPTLEQQVNELVVFVKKEYKTPLKQRRFDNDWCLRCHEHSSYEEIAERTADLERNPHAGHWGELDCRICHKMHRPSELYCATCHDYASLPEGWIVPSN